MSNNLQLSRPWATNVGALLLILMSCAPNVGCGRSDARSGDRPQIPVQPTAPVVQESLDDIRAHMAKLVLVEENRHRIASQQEFDAWRLKALLKLDEIRQREGVTGFKQTSVEKTGSQNGVVDPASHQIAWRAFTCWNPACLGKGKGGGPVVFAKQWENAEIGADGKLAWRTLKEDEQTSAITCPTCGLPDFVQYYDVPEVEIRRQKLAQELVKSREIRAAAEAAGQLVPAGVRTPTEIMKEQTELPKLFLVPEASK
ncbi:MAG: hypothetical protein K8T91_26960 [Planctomycetes bacterium]|nr:hypothetical protein [Planctomycetota bacterium]